MGFHRIPQPAALDRASLTAVVANLLAEEVAFLTHTADPFLIDHDCLNPAGHDPIATCRDIVCCHCAKVFLK
jgi:hypothetical protein